MSKLDTVNCGAVWVLTTTERATANGPAYSRGRCHLETVCKVYDAELQAIAEGLKYFKHKN